MIDNISFVALFLIEFSIICCVVDILGVGIIMVPPPQKKKKKIGKELFRAGSSFFPRGGFDPSSIFFFCFLRAAKRRGDFFFCAYFTSAKRRTDFFFCLFYEPRSGEPIFFWLFTSRFFWLFLRAAKRRADFFWLFWTPVSDVFLASTNAMETMITSLAAQGGGGVKPYCLRLSLRQSAIGTYCVGLDILWWRFSMHIKFLLGSPRGGGLNLLNPPLDPPLLLNMI